MMPNSAHSNSEKRNSSEWDGHAGRGRFKSGLHYFIVLALFGAFTFQLCLHAIRSSATIDEPVHILAGHRHLKCGDFGYNAEHPPLLKSLAAVPLMTRAFAEPDRDCGSRVDHKSNDFRSGMSFVAKNGVDGVVVPARLAAALMSLLLAALVFFAAREMFGSQESVVAMALFAFEPNLIAHGSLVTTDMALTTTMFAAVYSLYRFANRPGALRFCVAGLAVGLTLSAKHSGVLILPILFLILTADAFFLRDSEKNTRPIVRILRRTAAFAGIVFLAAAVLWAFYGFRFNALPNAAENSIPDLFIYHKEVENSFAARVVSKLNHFRILPESYNYGLADIIGTGSRQMFLFNEVYPTGRWFYFPVAFAVKTSVALLVMLPLGLLTLGLYRSRRREMLFLLAPPILFFAVAMTSGMNIGVRHVLPVYPFFIIAAAAGVCHWARKFPAARYALIALLIFHAATALRTAPDYIAFSNIFFGGVNNTRNVLADSNVEWGQSVKQAAEYVARENVADCWFAGNDNVEINRLLLQPCRLLPGSLGHWFASERLIEPTPPVIEGTILLSVWVTPPTSLLTLPPGGEEYSPVTRTEPIAVIGGSILVYRGRFEVPLVAALSHLGRARQLIKMNRFEEAVADARKTVEFAPGDPRSHNVLGVALAGTGQREEARRSFETAVRLAAANPSLFRWEEQHAQTELQKLK